MNEQEFGNKLFEASVKCIDIAGVAHCISEVDVNSKTAMMWLNSAIHSLASQIENLMDTLTELEEEFHSEGKFKYPGEIDTHTHTPIRPLRISIEAGCRIIKNFNYKTVFCF